MTDRSPIGKAGVIGLGRMGLPMARHLAAAGFAVRAYDTSEAARERAGDAGIGLADSPAGVAAQAELTLIIVPDDEDVLAVCRGPDGLIEGAGTGSMIAVCSSVRPKTVTTVEAEAAARGTAVLDLPLVGGIRAAEAGTLTLLAGGAAEDLARARPLLACFSDTIHHLGAAGSAQVAKTVNNLMLWMHLAASAEALRFGARHGLEPKRLREALFDCSADSWVLRELPRIQPVWPVKDMGNALVMAAEAGLQMPLAETVAQTIGALDRAALDALLAPDGPAA